MSYKNHKAILVDVNLKVRVIINDDIDPDTDKEFDELVSNIVADRIKEEGSSFVGESIENYEDDLINPYNPEYDINV